MLEEHNELNIKFAMDSLTQVRGTFNGIDKSKKVLVISPTTTYDLGSNTSYLIFLSNILLTDSFILSSVISPFLIAAIMPL